MGGEKEFGTESLVGAGVEIPSLGKQLSSILLCPVMHSSFSFFRKNRTLMTGLYHISGFYFVTSILYQTLIERLPTASVGFDLTLSPKLSEHV